MRSNDKPNQDTRLELEPLSISTKILSIGSSFLMTIETDGSASIIKKTKWKFTELSKITV